MYHVNEYDEYITQDDVYDEYTTDHQVYDIYDTQHQEYDIYGPNESGDQTMEVEQELELLNDYNLMLILM